MSRPAKPAAKTNRKHFIYSDIIRNCSLSNRPRPIQPHRNVTQLFPAFRQLYNQFVLQLFMVFLYYLTDQPGRSAGANELRYTRIADKADIHQTITVPDQPVIAYHIPDATQQQHIEAVTTHSPFLPPADVRKYADDPHPSNQIIRLQ